MKNTFKHGQQLQHSRYGVGTFELNEANEFRVVYDIIATDWRVIGNLHYSQLDPIEDLPEVGEYAYFWDDLMIEKKAYIIGKLGEIDKSDKCPYYCIGAACYQYISKTPPKFD